MKTSFCYCFLLLFLFLFPVTVTCYCFSFLRGAIHFHIVTPNYIRKELINQMWNEIVGKWQRKMNCQPQTLLPNIKAVNNISGYLAKYLSKEGQSIKGNMYGMSALTRELIKPIESVTLDFPPEIVNDVLLDVYNATKEKVFVFMSEDYHGNKCLWTNNLDVLQARLDLIHEMI